MQRFDTFDQVFQAVAEHFLPEAAGDMDALVRVQVTGQQGGVWYLHIHDGKLDVTTQPPADRAPDASIEVEDRDFWKLLYGEMDPLAAYMRGRLRVQGNLKLLTRLTFLFRLPEA